MPKKDEGKTVRIKESQTKYIEKVAEKLDTSFLEALYYIINYHREHHAGEIIEQRPNIAKFQTEIQQETQSKIQQTKELKTPDNDIDEVLGDFE